MRSEQKFSVRLLILMHFVCASLRGVFALFIVFSLGICRVHARVSARAGEFTRVGIELSKFETRAPPLVLDPLGIKMSFCAGFWAGVLFERARAWPFSLGQCV